MIKAEMIPPMTIRAALLEATSTLEAITPTPRLDAELLMAYALGTDRNAVLMRHLAESPPDSFEPLIARRMARDPVAYIIGEKHFWTLTLKVTTDVLIPRPESETLIEVAIKWFGDRSPNSILDLGTGSGALLLAALDRWYLAEGLGVDASEAALDVARANAKSTGIAPRAHFQAGDWAKGLAGPFDFILCNPPYIRRDATLEPEVLSEPHQALFGGDDGLDDYRILAPQIAGLMGPDSLACIEFGYGLGPSVTALLEAEGLEVECFHDLAGLPRCLRATRK
jgi:release factor glutamine methyltransferase